MLEVGGVVLKGGDVVVLERGGVYWREGELLYWRGGGCTGGGGVVVVLEGRGVLYWRTGGVVLKEGGEGGGGGGDATLRPPGHPHGAYRHTLEDFDPRLLGALVPLWTALASASWWGLSPVLASFVVSDAHAWVD